MPKPYPVEFRRDVVAVARKHEAPLTQIAKDFGISDASLYNWVARADLEDGLAPGLTQKDALELRDAKKRIRLLEQEAEVMRRAVAYLSRDVNPK
jgi:transposase-like protein